MPLLVILFLFGAAQLAYNNGLHMTGNLLSVLAAIYTALVIAELVGHEG